MKTRSEGSKVDQLGGFTFLEVMIVVLLIGILSVMATTSWKGIIGRMGSNTAVADLRGAIELSKTDALTRRRHSGIVIDRTNRRYLRFVDSSSSGSPDGQYVARDDRILVGWTKLHPDFLIRRISSSAAPQPVPRPCGATVARSARPIRGGMYSVVFRPDGSAWASLDLFGGSRSVPSDSFRVVVVPTTGLVMVAK